MLLPTSYILYRPMELKRSKIRIERATNGFASVHAEQERHIIEADVFAETMLDTGLSSPRSVIALHASPNPLD